MTTAPVYMETVKEAAIAILRAAVLAAADGTPLKGLYIPPHRFGSTTPDKWPFIELRVGDDDGKGISRQVPEFDFTGDLIIDGLYATGRDEAVDLDHKTSLLMQAICDTLLDDRTFIAFFNKFPGLRRQREDAAASDGKGGEFDAVLFRITITGEWREGYTPPLLIPADTLVSIDTGITAADQAAPAATIAPLFEVEVP